LYWSKLRTISSRGVPQADQSPQPIDDLCDHLSRAWTLTPVEADRYTTLVRQAGGIPGEIREVLESVMLDEANLRGRAAEEIGEILDELPPLDDTTIHGEVQATGNRVVSSAEAEAGGILRSARGRIQKGVDDAGGGGGAAA
jgi:hypothetical protein